MMFQNFAKNTCTGMKFKAICYEWQYACELKEILWHWEIRMHEFLKEQPVLKMKWCSVASSTTWQRNVCQRNDVEATIMLYMYLHIALLSPVIVYFPGPSTGLTYYNLSMYLSIAPRWNLRLQIFLTSIENNNYFAINTMSLYVHIHIHCIKAKLQQLLNAQETFKYNFK